MKAKSIRGKSPGEVKAALQNCIHDGFKPTLAFVFITAVEDIDGVVAILDAAGISIFGASTSEKFTEEGIGSKIALIVHVVTTLAIIWLSDLL